MVRIKRYTTYVEVRLKPDTTYVKEAQTPLEFVCEEDVRLAIQAGRKLVVSERAIVTPSARDLAEQHRVITFPPFHTGRN